MRSQGTLRDWRRIWGDEPNTNKPTSAGQLRNTLNNVTVNLGQNVKNKY